MQMIFWYDWIISFLLIIIVLKKSKKFVKKNSNDILISTYFKKGLMVKIIGCIAYAIYHQYIYKGGDCFSYFSAAKQTGDYLFTDFGRFIKLTFYPVQSSMNERLNDSWIDSIMVLSENNAFQVRIGAILQFFTFGTFVPTSLLFSLLSYKAIWKCFTTFCRLYPGKEKYIAISFLFIPSVVFWGSGIGKDCVCLASICALTTSAYYCFVFKERILKNIISIVLFTSILFIVKPYIVVAFLPPLVFALGLKKLSTIKNVLLKIIAFPISVGVIGLLSFFILTYASTSFSSLAVDQLAEKIVDAKEKMSMVSAGSQYDLGIKPESISGIGDLIPYFPKAVVACLFRPWLWEAKNPAMLLSGLEGFVFLLLVIYILIKGRIVEPILMILTDPILLSSLIYVVLFAGLVALSTSNFGTLVRYKLPCMPFLGVTLLVVFQQLKEKKKKKETKN